MKQEISCKVVADSLTQQGHRGVSIEAVIPRFILAELNTHRLFSRNSASSRAIPTKKILKNLKEDPFIPIAWQKEHPGMQGTQYYDENDKISIFEIERSIPQFSCDIWLEAKDKSMQFADALVNDAKVTKQIANRMLEPWMWHKVIVTSTEWENFTALRAHDAAEIHFSDFAHKVLRELNDSTPKILQPEEWHIPYGDDMNNDLIHDIVMSMDPTSKITYNQMKQIIQVKIATARANRTSYTTIDSEEKYNHRKDIQLHDEQTIKGHWSGFEHCMQAMSKFIYNNCVRTVSVVGLNDNSIICDFVVEKGWLGNVRGFIQYRKMFKEEVRQDSRLIDKSYLLKSL